MWREDGIKLLVLSENCISAKNVCVSAKAVSQQKWSLIKYEDRSAPSKNDHFTPGNVLLQKQHNPYFTTILGRSRYYNSARCRYRAAPSLIIIPTAAQIQFGEPLKMTTLRPFFGRSRYYNSTRYRLPPSNTFSPVPEIPFPRYHV